MIVDQYGLKVIAEPATEPVTLNEAKAHLRVDIADEDSLIEGLITAARERVEQYLCRALITTKYTMTLDSFGPAAQAFWPVGTLASAIHFPRNPVQSVDEIRYIDTDEVQETLPASDYRVDSATIVGRVTPAYGLTWPATLPVTNAVEIDFTAGYGDAADDVPMPIRQAIKIMVMDLYGPNREGIVIGTVAAEIPMGVKWMLKPYAVSKVM